MRSRLVAKQGHSLKLVGNMPNATRAADNLCTRTRSDSSQELAIQRYWVARRAKNAWPR